MDPSNKRRRRAFTDADRVLIRTRNRTHPPKAQKELVDWFTAETGHYVTQGQMSKILSPAYQYLDSLDLTKDAT